MPRGEGDSSQQREPEQLGPFELPADLAEFLADEEYAMVTTATDQGTAYVIKAPLADLTSMAGQVPIEVQHELYHHPLAPIVRTVVRVYDQPESPLAFESFINVADEGQWAEYANLSERETLTFLFYDETLSHRLTKQVRNGASDHMRNILNWADHIKAAIPKDEYDFDSAKAALVRHVRF
jgi:hypothetical protein